MSIYEKMMPVYFPTSGSQSATASSSHTKAPPTAGAAAESRSPNVSPEPDEPSPAPVPAPAPALDAEMRGQDEEKPIDVPTGLSPPHKSPHSLNARSASELIPIRAAVAAAVSASTSPESKTTDINTVATAPETEGVSTSPKGAEKPSPEPEEMQTTAASRYAMCSYILYTRIQYL